MFFSINVQVDFSFSTSYLLVIQSIHKTDDITLASLIACTLFGNVYVVLCNTRHVIIIFLIWFYRCCCCRRRRYGCHCRRRLVRASTINFIIVIIVSFHTITWLLYSQEFSTIFYFLMMNECVTLIRMPCRSVHYQIHTFLFCILNISRILLLLLFLTNTWVFIGISIYYQFCNFESALQNNIFNTNNDIDRTRIRLYNVTDWLIWY